MAGQRGRDFLLKLAGPDGAFVTIAGLRAKTLSFDARSIDITHADSPDSWRELLAGGGIRTAGVEAQGLFRDAASDALLRQLFFSQEIGIFQLVIADFGRVEGPFLVARLDYSGAFDGEQSFSLRLASAGALVFTAI